MNYFKSQKFKDIAGFIAAIILSTACLAAATFHINVILDLKHHGVRVNARVVDISRGARNSSWAVYQYAIANGQHTTARDKFQQYIKRVHKGETVWVIYHRNDVETVTADLGIWIWQAPAIFLSGFLLLAVLAFFIWRKRST
jgi:hypothetical protein